MSDGFEEAFAGETIESQEQEQVKTTLRGAEHFLELNAVALAPDSRSAYSQQIVQPCFAAGGLRVGSKEYASPTDCHQEDRKALNSAPSQSPLSYIRASHYYRGGDFGTDRYNDGELKLTPGCVGLECATIQALLTPSRLDTPAGTSMIREVGWS
jgi:hypothetical protein